MQSGRGSVHTPEDTKRQNGSHPTVGGAIGAQGLEESNTFPGGSLTYEYALKCLESAMVLLKTDTDTAVAEVVEKSRRSNKSSGTVGGQGVELAGLIWSVSREGEDASMLAQAAAVKVRFWILVRAAP